jgi:hypothetical protein
VAGGFLFAEGDFENPVSYHELLNAFPQRGAPVKLITKSGDSTPR